MRVININKNSNNQPIVEFHLGYEEIDLIFSIIEQAWSTFPRRKYESDYQRLKNIYRSLSEFVGKSHPKPPKSSDFPCPRCDRFLRTERAVQQHLLQVHGQEIRKEVLNKNDQ